MRFDREQDPLEDTQFFEPTSEPTTESVWQMPGSAREQREIRFRERKAGRTATTGSGLDARRVKLAAGFAAAIAIAVLVAWGIAGVYRANADSSSAAAVAANVAATKISAASAKKAAKGKHSKSKHTSTAAASRKHAAAKPTLKATSVAAAAKSGTAARTTVSVASARSAAAIVPVSSGQVVVIDAGHQAQGDSSLEPIGPGSSQKKPKVSDGASGSHAPHAESEVNLEVALKLRAELQARGVKVIMVRTSQNVNISNSQRAAIANKAHAALFIRLHCDGIGNSSTHGFSTLIPASNHWTGPIVASSAKAGAIVQSAALKATGARNAGVVQRGDLSGFNWAKVPTILVEMGFMSNPSEDAALTSAGYQHKLAAGLADGVLQYLKSH